VAVPDSDDESVTEEGNKEIDSSLPKGDAPFSSAYPCTGMIREPCSPDSDEEVEEGEDDQVDDPAPVAAKRPRKATNKRPGKKAKTGPSLVQTKLTSSVKSAPAKDPEHDDYVMISESEDEDLPRIKG
jgi:hypothetical protein